MGHDCLRPTGPPSVLLYPTLTHTHLEHDILVDGFLGDSIFSHKIANIAMSSPDDLTKAREQA